ncbi:hypothetical protein [Bradyrhizobium prioriisuperbiae]|uniref:hypothetical protein n=1 Tax=Bradyrhizobium prioriisuperbiae TaxID=2854389 RepID=UPI0028ECD2FB|nr:hypothetical protein [Bradyrhizobium prioritasuperba]
MALPIEAESVTRHAWLPFAKAVSFCYREPERAVQRMSRYHGANGQDAFLAKLTSDPYFFGIRNALTPYPTAGRSRRGALRRATILLPLLAKAAFDTGMASAPLIPEDV